jgi:3-hydroxyisobutyrate dehydrogenase-like beta-hydroxyacid dehydrogenase
MAEVAVLGTGRMGAAMARRVAAGGHRLTVWNRTRATAGALVASLPAGDATRADSPAEAVTGRDVVLTMLADGATTCEVLLDSAVLARLGPRVVVCDLATSGVAAARTLARELGQAGVAFVDAPVSGSVPAVEAGTLLVMAGGDGAVIDSVRPVLESFARRVVRVGEAGTGQAMKLAVNLVVHDLNAALAESLVLAERSGIAREQAYDVLQDSVVGAPFVHYKRSAFLDPDTPVAMSLGLVRKDLRLIADHARELHVPMNVTAAALLVVAEACSAGLGEDDMAALSRFPAPVQASVTGDPPES